MSQPAIVLATANQGKIREISSLLEHWQLRILTLADFPELGEIAETGKTFEQNALLKALGVAKATGLPAMADDSGLMVDALNGAPGIYSARYGDDWEALPNESRDARNIRKLLRNMEHEENNRACHFVTSMAAARPDGKSIVSRGIWSGELLKEPVGSNGFGYDPVFFDPAVNKTAAELSEAEKNSRSHRGKALTALLRQLPQFLDLDLENI